jgi:hypothetical protein
MASKEILLISKKAFCIARTWQKRVKKWFFCCHVNQGKASHKSFAL